MSNKFAINGMVLMDAFEKYPELFCYMEKNKEYLDDGMVDFMNGICDIFQPEVPIGSFGRIKVPETEWQEDERHRYVKIELIHCDNYNGYLLPFHNEQRQYGGFFINIEPSVRANEVILFWDDQKVSDGSYEEYTWTSSDNIEIIYAQSIDDDEKDKKIGMQDMFLKYLKYLCNLRLDEIEESSEETFKILLLRLRGKIRVSNYGKISSVQGIVSASVRDVLEEKLMNIVDEDEEFNKNSNVVSYKLTRSKLFGDLQIDPSFIIRIFDGFGKELKLCRSILECELYNTSVNGYNNSLKSLTTKINQKYANKSTTMETISGFNGLRVTFNKKTRGVQLTTNYFQSSFGRIDLAKNKFPIIETLGRKSGW